jgi:hypothetical protein
MDARITGTHTVSGSRRAIGRATLVRPQRRRLACAVLILVTAAVMSAGPGVASGKAAEHAASAEPLDVVSESVVYCPTTGMVHFALRFDRRPDFRTVDEFGRRHDSFQYFIVGDNTQPFPQNYDAIIRGDELTLRRGKGVIPIRRSEPSDPDPASGGWGPIRTVVPLRLRGSVVRFSVPLSALSNHTTEGLFAYELLTVNFGSTVDFFTNESVVRSC